MAVQKKHGKGRLDKWYKLAKEKGYRARAAFKLIQLNKKYGFLEKSKVLLDLCAAPGSWCQVAAETMPANSIIVGVDLSPIKSIPKVITFQSDITTEKCRATIRQHLKTWKADTVLHDGAPNVGTAWVQDSFNQAELALQAMKLATDFLIEGGTFVTKVFRSKDYNSLLWVFNQLFTKVEATKPPSSRNVSAEIFVVCRGFKAPKRIDPRFLDPKAVFAELADPTPNNEAKVYNPEVKKRKRDGYEEGDYTQFKEMPASEFIQTTDPIAILGQYNRLSFEQPKNGDVALAALDKLPETTEEIRLSCADLKVLSRKEFKVLLRWRLRVRELFGFPSKKTAAKPLSEEVTQVDTMDEEMKIQQELQAMKDRTDSKKKREKRKENEKKQKDIVRMQMNMTAPMDIGMEQADAMGDGSMFALKKLQEPDALRRIAKGKMAFLNTDKKVDRDSGIGSSGETDNESDEEEDRLERELDGLYDEYQDRKSSADAKYRAKKARERKGDDDWEGFSGEDKDIEDSDGDLEEDSSDDDDDTAGGKPTKSLLTDLDNGPDEEGGLSKRARSFFNQDIFKDIPGVLDDLVEEEEGEDEDEDEEEEEEGEIEDEEMPDVDENDAEEDDIPSKGKSGKKGAKEEVTFDESESEDGGGGGFEVVKRSKQDTDENDWEEEDKRLRSDGRLDIDIITAEAMTLAQSLASGQRLKHDVIDDGFNKHAFRDKDGLPEWFLDDESRHDKLHRPITKAGADAIKEKMRAFNARPIKKVREAQARKKFKAVQKLEKLKKKSELLIADEGMTEKEKGDTISKMLSKAAKKKPHTPMKVVVARGSNRGIKGRPKGVKGRYKLVDARMKKETRALKRVAKKYKK
ncbi:rRNA methyltransferase [Grosmannia clavigera kw1407]|uniref:rRNA methyltransferase n=1 Tax=Grosmannia clavigera (strain kw1407 / UAMH 11150) TaxID=655863 RepID=F0X979_GROCL|nr:rRNA methyltransferase [Grosmannia clavigera kw1407]EFX06045.1 rRNA methyltransferase [Grosmannia clavigera kw1407]